MSRVLLVSLVLSLGCQPQATIRDARAYRLEAMFFKKVIEEQQRIVAMHIKANCCLEAGFKGGEECDAIGETYGVVHSSAQHHYDRMMFLGGFTKTDPGALVETDLKSLLNGVCYE